MLFNVAAIKLTYYVKESKKCISTADPSRFKVTSGQVLGPGESRHHTFTTTQGLAKQITIVAQQVGNEGNFKESYLVKPC